MKVLLIHAYYQQLGGEDLCFEAEVRLLESRGIEVQTYTFDNHEVDRWSTSRKALNLLWNGRAHSDVTALIDKFRPDVVHVYNTFPGLSGAVFSAAHGKGVPSVAVLSNYRITCVNGLLFRQGSVCESCLGSKLAWRGALHGCYRDSRVMSAAVAGSNAFHWLRGTWSEDISAFVALDEDGRDRFVQVGLPAARLHVRPNFMDPLPDPGSGEGEFALYAGRLAHGKGLKTLLRAWRDHEDLPDLRIAGDGPLLEASRQAADSDTRIRLLGGLSPEELATVMGEAMMTVVPSESYETFGRVAMESMALGTPVVSSTSGALKNVVRDGVGGLLFEPGQSGDLANAVCRVARGRGPSRSSTREDAAKRFSGDAAFSTLMEVYSAAGVNVPLTLRPPKEGLDRQALRTQRGMRTPRGRAYPTG